MTHTALVTAVRKQVPSIPNALAALAEMEHELSTAKTYEEIRRTIREASALKILLGHVAEVKASAEDTILIANRRIGEEIAKVPKAKVQGPGRSKKRITPPGKSFSGRGALGVPGTSRSRLLKLAHTPASELKKVAADLRSQGKDATIKAVVTLITQGDKKERRATRERDLAAKLLAMPDKKYGVIVSDDEWDYEPYSRETGMDRHASNHSPTAANAHTAEELHERTKDRFACAAEDCVLFMWTTVPHLAIAIDLLRLRGFRYASNYTWGKDKAGTGHWNRNKHEHLLIGVRGKVPCPAPGMQSDSLIMAPRGEHSAKPVCFLAMIEQYFPTLPKIELNRRGAPRPGWDAWGDEVPRAPPFAAGADDGIPGFLDRRAT